MADDRTSQVTHWHAANRLRREITDSGLAAGDKIEPEKELADRYGVARGTMRKALAQLRDEGVLASVHGRGTYVAAVPRRAVVPLRPGDRLRSWLPDDAERRRMRLPPGVPVLQVTRAGGAVEWHDASRTDVTGPSPAPAGEGPEYPGSG